MLVGARHHEAVDAAPPEFRAQQLQAGGVLMALITTAMTGPLFDRFQPAAAPSAAAAPEDEPVTVPVKRPPPG
jgi:hypothetical protein